MPTNRSKKYFEEVRKEDDEEVQRMIDTWDMVECSYCHKEISMLNANLITLEDGSEAFVCKTHK